MGKRSLRRSSKRSSREAEEEAEEGEEDESTSMEDYLKKRSWEKRKKKLFLVVRN